MSERKGIITFQGQGLTLMGTEIAEGDTAPDFSVLSTDLEPVNFKDYAGQTVIIASVPSLDTSVCSMEARRFDDEASRLKDTTVLVISMDLPFAQKRWQEESGVGNIRVLSDHKEAGFGEAYGVLIKELRLLARCVFVVDAEGRVRHRQIVPEVTDEPDYDAAIKAARETLAQPAT